MDNGIREAAIIRPVATSAPLRVVAVASGKGGVGKTSLAANLAVSLAKRGLRVCVLDADLGLANLDVVLGLTPARSLLHVLRGEARLEDVIVEGPAGIRVVPSASGFLEMTSLGAEQQLALLAEVDTLEQSLDVLLIDVGAGIAPNVLFFAAAAAETLVVLTPEPTALTDAYALIKLLATRHGRQEFLVVVNMAVSVADADAAFRRLQRVAERFLRVRLEYQGFIPFDDAVSRAVRRQNPVVIESPGTPASQAIMRLAQRLAARPPAAPSGGVQFFFRRLVAEGGV
ncbi:MAG TPA: MinD/ParA family protein [Candidatus Binatia bacterium]|jgi:flagellar biosynthesis protein FlhG|nr:MinD/ParA family protein [Candidatus Binatia bacterium]